MSADSSGPRDLKTWLWNVFWWARGAISAFVLLSAFSELFGLGSFRLFFAIHVLLLEWGQIFTAFVRFFNQYVPLIEISVEFINAIMLTLTINGPGLYVIFIRPKEGLGERELFLPSVFLMGFFLLCNYWFFSTIDLIVYGSDISWICFFFVFILIVVVASQVSLSREMAPRFINGLFQAVILLVLIQIAYFLGLPGLHGWIDQQACLYAQYAHLSGCP